MLFGGDDSVIKRSIGIIAVMGFLLSFFAFAFGVIRPRTVLPYKCYSWNYKLSFQTIVSVGPLELREPVWMRSCGLVGR